MFRKSACPFGQVKTEMYLPESPFFFRNLLARASGLVLMSVPGRGTDEIRNCPNNHTLQMQVREIKLCQKLRKFVNVRITAQCGCGLGKICQNGYVLAKF